MLRLARFDFYHLLYFYFAKQPCAYTATFESCGLRTSIRDTDKPNHRARETKARPN